MLEKNKPNETTKNCNGQTQREYKIRIQCVSCSMWLCKLVSFFNVMFRLGIELCVRMFSRRTLRRQTMAYIKKDLLNSTQTCNEHILDIFRAFFSHHNDLLLPPLLLLFQLFSTLYGKSINLNDIEIVICLLV